jgi:excisionase family DNA binding protein
LTAVLDITRRIRATAAGIDTAAVYTVAETASLLTLSLGSTYALIREGAIPAKKIGGRWIIPKERFHQWLNALTSDDDSGAVPATAVGRR